jgi:hypothetical protein
MMYGFFGFIVQKPIRHIALRALFIILVAVLCARAVVVLYIVGPLLLPWHGDTESFVSLTSLLGMPLQLLAAFALWQYASVSPRTPSGLTRLPVSALAPFPCHGGVFGVIGQDRVG